MKESTRTPDDVFDARARLQLLQLEARRQMAARLQKGLAATEEPENDSESDDDGDMPGFTVSEDLPGFTVGDDTTMAKAAAPREESGGRRRRWRKRRGGEKGGERGGDRGERGGLDPGARGRQ